MADFRPASPDQAAFREELVGHGLLIESGVAGLYGRSGDFERVRHGLDALITRAAAPDAPESLSFPPLLPRRHLEQNGYLESFPHLAGAVFAFAGSETDAVEQHERASRHQDWSEFQSMTDLVLTPAACYPVYPAVAARGRLAPGGVVVDAGGAYVFRNEPSGDPSRLQMFHQREMVCIGEPEVVAGWRGTWLDRALGLLQAIGLEAHADVATDPFFGRSGRMLAASQREQALKFEILVRIAGSEPTAVASFNCHEEHFAEAHRLELDDGSLAHTACLGFGGERLTLALLATHGFDLDAWPEPVRRELWDP